MTKFSPDAVRYLIWTGALLLGAVLAVVDHRKIGRWVFGALLVAGITCGLLLTIISPFSFGSTNYYMEGVIIAGGSSLALVGYVIAQGAVFVWQRTRDGRR